MTSNRSRSLLILFLIIGSCHPSSINRNNGNNKASFSPIKELGPSLAASVAGGTVIAVRSRVSVPSLNARDVSQVSLNEHCEEDEDCIVILFRSPDVSRKNHEVDQAGAHNLTVASVYGPSAPNSTDTQTNSHQFENDSTTNTQQSALSSLHNGPLHHPYLSNTNQNTRILHAPTGLILAATGFKPDITHLLHIAAGRLLSRSSIYDSSPKTLDPHKLVRQDLSDILIDAASTTGGRPLGIQCLVIGQSCISRGLELYTIDPAGGWKSHVGWGAVVGRGGERVRTCLNKLRRREVVLCEEEQRRGWKLALDKAMFAAVDAFEIGEDSLSSNDENKAHLYCAMVVFGSGKQNERDFAMAATNSRCAAVHPNLVEESYKRCFQRLLSEKKMIVGSEE